MGILQAEASGFEDTEQGFNSPPLSIIPDG
jgi:hypothetical protein